jgi:hypothetical protein
VNLIVSMVLAFSLGPFGSSRNIGTVLPVICGVFFGGLALWDLLALLPRSYSLTLDPAGFAVRLLFRQRYYRWSEVNAFSVGSSNKVVYNFSNADQRQIDRRRRGPGPCLTATTMRFCHRGSACQPRNSQKQ